MADESRAKEPSYDVPADVEVIDLRRMSRSTLLHSMFVAGKAWILSLWKNKKDQIKNITILDKVIGKNKGFILRVSCTDPTSDTTFYAKLQRASMDTVLVHHLLKNMKCGPERFHIVLLKGPCDLWHGVITEEVKDWSMAMALTRDQTTHLLNEKKKFTTAAFLLTILVELGQFGFIPSNRENWGFITGADAAVPYPHMAVIDFSRGDYSKHTFHDKRTFESCWQNNLAYLFDKWHPVCGPIEDLQLFRDRMSDLRKSVMHGTCIKDEIQHFSFLQSREAFVNVLQSACDETALWLHYATHGRSMLTYQNPDTRHPRTHSSTLHPYRFVPRYKAAHLVSPFTTLVGEYERYFKCWSRNLSYLNKWFPFPNNVVSPVRSVEPAVTAEGVLSAVSISDVTNKESVAKDSDVSHGH